MYVGSASGVGDPPAEPTMPIKTRIRGMPAQLWVFWILDPSLDLEALSMADMEARPEGISRLRLCSGVIRSRWPELNFALGTNPCQRLAQVLLDRPRLQETACRRFEVSST